MDFNKGAGAKMSKGAVWRYVKSVYLERKRRVFYTCY